MEQEVAEGKDQSPAPSMRDVIATIARHRASGVMIGAGVGLVIAGILMGHAAVRATGMTVVVIGVILVGLVCISQRLQRIECAQREAQPAATDDGADVAEKLRVVQDELGTVQDTLKAERIVRRARNSYERDSPRRDPGAHAADRKPKLSLINGSKGLLALPVLGLWGAKDATVATVTATAIAVVPFAIGPMIENEDSAYATTSPSAAQVEPLVVIDEVQPAPESEADVEIEPSETAKSAGLDHDTVRSAAADEATDGQLSEPVSGGSEPADKPSPSEPEPEPADRPDDDYELDDNEPDDEPSGGQSEPVEDVVTDLVDTTEQLVDGLLGVLR